MRGFAFRRVFRIPVFLRRHGEQEVDEELAFHLAMRADRLRRDGLAADVADDESRRRFGDLGAIRAECLHIDEGSQRRERVGRVVDAVVCDVRFAGRTLRRSPTFVVASVLSLALAIGATVATFLIVDGLLLRPQPWSRPGELFLLKSRFMNELQQSWSQPMFENIRQAGVFPAVASFARRSVTLAAPAGDSGIRVDAEFVSPTYLPLVGVVPARGRSLAPTRGGSEEVATALISARLERRMFPGGTAIGRTLRVNGIALVVVGTMPDEFFGLSGTSDLWVPLAAAPTVWGISDAFGESDWYYRTAVRVPAAWNDARRAGALWDLEQAVGYHGTFVTSGAAGADEPPVEGPKLELAPAAGALVDRSVASLLWILLAAACSVLVLACTNVASLTIAKLASRHTELAVRQALGASSLRLAGSLFVEATLLALTGAAAGLLFAEWVSKMLWAVRPTTGGPMAQQLATAQMPSIDGRVIAFVAAVTLATVALLCIWPWIEIRRPFARSAFALGRRSARKPGRREQRVRNGLSMVQLGLAFTVTTSAVLLIATYRVLTRLDNGVVSTNVVTMRLDLPLTRYDAARAVELYHTLMNRVRLAPGVVTADVASVLPLDGGDRNGVAVIDSLLPKGRGGQGTPIEFNAVGPTYFRTLGVGVTGIAPDDRPRGGLPMPVVVSQAAAKAFWPARSPIGQPIEAVMVESGWRPAIVVGVVPDVQYGLPGAAPQPTIYTAYSDSPPMQAALIVKTAPDHADAIAGIRSVLHEIDPLLVLYDVKTMDERIATASSVARFGALVLASYAAVAFMIALIGVYSVIAYGVAQRRPEFGVRMALGASPARILSSVLTSGLAVTASGLVLGIIGSTATHRLIASQLAGATSGEAVYYAGALAVFVLAGVAASVAPARSATRVDPARALRAED